MTYTYIFLTITNIILFVICFISFVYNVMMYSFVTDEKISKIYRNKYLLSCLITGLSLGAVNILLINEVQSSLCLICFTTFLILFILFFLMKYKRKYLKENYIKIKKIRNGIKIYWILIISSFSLIIISIYIDRLINITLIPLLISFLVVPISSQVLKYIENKETEKIKYRIHFASRFKKNKLNIYLINIERFYLDMQLNIYIVCLSFVSSYIFTKFLLVSRYKTIDQVFNLIRIDNSESFYTMLVASMISLIFFLFVFRKLVNYLLKKLGIKTKKDSFLNIKRPQI